VKIETTHYYDEFLRYYSLAKTQQDECNLGTIPHMAGTVKDPLMQHVELYDVVNRKYAGFTQILLDLWYGNSNEHPYSAKLHSVRSPICEKADRFRETWDLADWLYVFIVHRVTGSGINYAKKPSGYNNTILPALTNCRDLNQMITTIKCRDRSSSIFTSVGYQFPAFPKVDDRYTLGGDMFLCEYAPRLADQLAEFLSSGSSKPLREVGEWMFRWNARNDLRAYRFQYAAIIADIADFFPATVDRTSPFYYGTNAIECISYLARPLGRGPKELFLDEVMAKIQQDTDAHPYDAEDVCCDFIRWIENYVRPGADYDHVDRDAVWNSSTITDHPFGRQKAMLSMGLIKSFNELSVHPSDDYVLKRVGLTADDYRLLVG